MSTAATLHDVEKFPFITVRIQTVNSRGEHGSGTGFWFRFDLEEQKQLPLIITNKHVLKQVDKISMIFTEGRDGVPQIGSLLSISSDDADLHVVEHPDPEVDIAAIIAQPILNYFYSQGKQILRCLLGTDVFLRDDMKEHISPIENVLMVGYPNGVWDSANNMPIFRHGLTATSLLLDFEGKSQFVIDAACYPGSSGSPILLHNSGIWAGKDGEARLGSRFAFLGILYAGPMLQVTGNIVVIDVPTVQTPISISSHMLNLGYCIKAERITELLTPVIAHLSSAGT